MSGRAGEEDEGVYLMANIGLVSFILIIVAFGVSTAEWFVVDEDTKILLMRAQIALLWFACIALQFGK